MTPKNKFVPGVIMVSIVFLITRLPYFIYYPVATVSMDSASYIACALQILDFNAPLFDIRTPGYPLLLSVIWALSKNFISVSLVQSVATYLVSIIFLSISYKYYSRHVMYFAFAVCGFISSAYFLVLEMSILTEGIFTSIMLLTAGVLIVSVKSKSALAWAVCSFLIGVLILVRPAGLFLTALFVPLLAYFIVNKYRLRHYLCLIFPFSLLIGSLCIYNYQTLGKFTITPFGEANLAGVTVLFMEPSEKYPEFVNKSIVKTLEVIPRSDIKYVNSSYNPNRLFTVFKDHFHMQMDLVNNMKSFDSTLTYIRVQPYLRQISLDAISRHPAVYAKFVYCNLYYFFTNVGRTTNYRAELERKYKQIVIDSIYYKQLGSGKWSQIANDKGVISRVEQFYQTEFDAQRSLDGFVIGEQGKVSLLPTFLLTLFEYYEMISNFVFRNVVWLILFAIALALSVIILYKSRFTDDDAFIALMFSLIFLLKAVLVSMVESSLERYSYTVEFVLFMSLPFTLILLNKRKQINLTNKK